ncbi:MAG: hypothetical protein AB8G14_12255 [Ilumatobacter sp.]
MKRIAILAIAATNQAVYQHYITSYWTELIRHVEANVAHIDVYLLTEHGSTNEWYRGVIDAVIEDPDPDVGRLLAPRFRTISIPGVLSKTVHALEVLAGRYDVFFRTNLSSMVMLNEFDRFVQSAPNVSYSGGFIHSGALRRDLIVTDRIGADRSITELSELDAYPGNSFASGSGFFLSARDAERLVEERSQLRFDLPDDVAIGLMFERATHLTGFSQVVTPETSITEMLQQIDHCNGPHVRLQHFPLERAMALWRYVHAARMWQ